VAGERERRVTTTAPRFDLEGVRARFTALQRDLVFFDGPGGTQVPDSVIEAIAAYLRESNANVSGPYETSRRTEAVFENARATAARFLGCSPEEIVFGPNMTTLNFALSRTVARSFRRGDEILVTRLDHDGNVAPWLELAHDLGLVVRFVDIREDCSLDMDDLERQLGERTRVVAFPLASNAVGTVTEASRITALAHEAGALAWADAVHYGPHGQIDVEAIGLDVLACSTYKFFGPHLGIAFTRRAVAEEWRPYKVRPQSSEPLGHRFETGTQAYELLAGMIAAVEYVDSIGWPAIVSWERTLGERFLDGLPDGCRLHGLPTMTGRVPTFAFTHDGLPSSEVAARLGERGFAVWHGNYYALEIMHRLGLEDGGAVRVGLVHYNTLEEVDHLLEELARLE
jgi:cysteine desulfurase family protein (TIGR01976 family)